MPLHPAISSGEPHGGKEEGRGAASVHTYKDPTTAESPHSCRESMPISTVQGLPIPPMSITEVSRGDGGRLSHARLRVIARLQFPQLTGGADSGSEISVGVIRVEWGGGELTAMAARMAGAGSGRPSFREPG